MNQSLACPAPIGATLSNGRIVVGASNKSRSKQTKTFFKVLSLKDGTTENVLSYLADFENTTSNRALLTIALEKICVLKDGFASEPWMPSVVLVKGVRLHLYTVTQSEGLSPYVYWRLPKDGMTVTEALMWVLNEEVATPGIKCVLDNRDTANLKSFRV